MSDVVTLGYGKAVVVGPYRCSSSSAGIRCVMKATSHGFAISRQAILTV